MTARARNLQIGVSGVRGHVQANASSTSIPVKTVFHLAASAVILHFVVSSNVLYGIGISYNVPGGNPLAKFHPSTYLAIFAAMAALYRDGGAVKGPERMFREAPAIFGLICAMFVCSVYSVISVGYTGAAIFVENYVSAGMIAYALECCAPQERLRLARIMLVLTLINVLVATGENVTHAHVITPYFGADEMVEAAGDFRGTAGFAHPLIGAMVVMMSLLALPDLALPPLLAGVAFGVLGLGLIAFGGRTALGVSIIGLALLTGYLIAKSLILRRPNIRLIGAVALALIIIPPAVYALLNYTIVGERLMWHFYVDESAEVRSVQWQVLRHLSLHDVLFGMPEDQIPFLRATVSLDAQLDDIESPWLMTFIKIGVVGSPILLAGLLPFLVRLWRLSGLWGRALLVCGLVVTSASISIGVKSEVLFMMVAFIVTMKSYGAASPARLSAASDDAGHEVSRPVERITGRALRVPSARAGFNRTASTMRMPQ